MYGDELPNLADDEGGISILRKYFCEFGVSAMEFFVRKKPIAETPSSLRMSNKNRSSILG